MMAYSQPNAGRKRNNPTVVDGYLETNLPEEHRPIRIENRCGCEPTNSARRGTVPPPSGFGSFFTLPCPFFTTIKRLVTKKPQPCSPQRPSPSPPPPPPPPPHKTRSENVPRKRPPNCQCPSDVNERLLHVDVRIPERFFSPVDKGDWHNERKGPVKDVVKTAVSGMQTTISEDQCRYQQISQDGNSARFSNELAICEQGISAHESQKYGASYDRNRKCSCASVNQKTAKASERQRGTRFEKQSSSERTVSRGASDKKVLAIKDVPESSDDNYDNYEHDEPEHKSESSLAKKLKDLAGDSPEKSSEHSGNSSAHNDGGTVSGDVSGSVVGNSEEENYGPNVKEESDDVGPEHVQSVTNYEEEEEKQTVPEHNAYAQNEEPSTRKEDVLPGLSQAVPPSLSLVVPPNSLQVVPVSSSQVVPPISQDVPITYSQDVPPTSSQFGASTSSANQQPTVTIIAASNSTAVAEENAVTKVYTSVTSLVHEITSNVDINKPTLTALILLLLFIIGMLLMYLLSQDCTYKKPRIYNGNCHLFS